MKYRTGHLGKAIKVKGNYRMSLYMFIEWLLSGHGEIISGKKEVMTNFDQIEQFYFRYI